MKEHKNTKKQQKSPIIIVAVGIIAIAGIYLIIANLLNQNPQTPSPANSPQNQTTQPIPNNTPPNDSPKQNPPSQPEEANPQAPHGEYDLIPTERVEPNQNNGGNPQTTPQNPPQQNPNQEFEQCLADCKEMDLQPEVCQNQCSETQ